MGDTILFNNKEIEFVSMVKRFFGRNGLWKELKRIENLLDEKKRQVLPFTIFQRKYSLKKTSFLHMYFQVISAIPGHLLTK